MEKKPMLEISDVPEISEHGFYPQLTRGRMLSDFPHAHNFCEFVCVISGECDHFINGSLIKMSTGDAVLLRPNDTHYFCGQTDNTNIMALSVSTQHIDSFLNSYGIERASIFAVANPPCFKFPISELPRLTSLCDRATLCSEEALGKNSRMLLGEIMSCILQCDEPSATIPKEFLNLISEMQNPNNIRKGLPALLKISHYSHSHLCRLTLQYLNKTPLEYVNELRLCLAAEKLRTTSNSIEAIAADCGFSSYSHFCRIFKEYYLLTPSKFRKQSLTTFKTL